MPRLLLMRHAKSAWGDINLKDRDRPLSPRGIRSAPQVADAMARDGLVPDCVLCSTAQRARQTLALALHRWDADMRIIMTHAVYEADENSLFELIGKTAADLSPATLAVIGHNPVLEDLTEILSGAGSDSDALHRAQTKFPTAAVAVLATGSDGWAELKPRGMQLERFITPRDLKSRDLKSRKGPDA